MNYENHLFEFEETDLVQKEVVESPTFNDPNQTFGPSSKKHRSDAKMARRLLRKVKKTDHMNQKMFSSESIIEQESFDFDGESDQ